MYGLRCEYVLLRTSVGMSPSMDASSAYSGWVAASSFAGTISTSPTVDGSHSSLSSSLFQISATRSPSPGPLSPVLGPAPPVGLRSTALSMTSTFVTHSKRGPRPPDDLLHPSITTLSLYIPRSAFSGTASDTRRRPPLSDPTVRSSSPMSGWSQETSTDARRGMKPSLAFNLKYT